MNHFSDIKVTVGFEPWCFKLKAQRGQHGTKW